MYSKQLTTSLKNIIIYSRNIQKSSGFYTEGLGLKITLQSEEIVEMKDASNSKIILKNIQSEAFLNKGYSPLLNFQIQDIDKTIQRLMTYGAIKDGEIIENQKMKIACIRSPDGVMIGLTQILQDESGSESDYDKNQNEESDASMNEIKNILRKIKM